MDVQVVERAQRGEQEPFEQLARAAARRLYPVAVRILREPDLANDALQATLVTVWRELPKLRDPARFEAWSHRILLRFCQRELTMRRSLAPRVDDSWPTNDHDATSGLALRDQLERGIRNLSAAHRTVLVLIYFKGLTEAEAARLLGVSPGTVASRVHYAKRSLRAALEADARSPEASTDVQLALS